jgi:hypothetical protein
MKLKLFLFLLAFSPMLSFAQGCLTIFSEDGDRFYLILNGVRQNNAPQTNVRIDGLLNEFYNAKIIFEDQSKTAITKNMPVKDATGQWAEMTYKLKRGKDGQLKLRYFSETPVPVNYAPPPGMYVGHYVADGPGETITQTTTTVTQTNGTGANLNVNAAGLNMSVNVNDADENVNMNINVGGGAVNRATTRTTTTTSYSTTSTTGTQNVSPARTGCAYPMAARDFNSAMATIKNTSFEETKLSTAKSIIGSNCLSTNQIVDICGLFSFEESKLDFAKAAYSRTTDPTNYFKVVNVFSFDASKTELNEFISR